MTENQPPATPEPSPSYQAGPLPGRHAPDRNLALELARVTEAGAMAAARWVGRGDKNGADAAAVNAMRLLVNTVSMKGVVVIGEGGEDHAPMLYNGEQIGAGWSSVRARRTTPRCCTTASRSVTAAAPPVMWRSTRST